MSDDNGQAGFVLNDERSSWEEVQQLQAKLARERDLRQMRIPTFSALDEAIRGLRSELVEERHRIEHVENCRLVAHDQSCRAERCFEALQEEHSALLKYKATQEVDMRRHVVAAFASEKAMKEASRDGGWAREGPEMEALKDAKIALAEVLAELDEVQLQARRETAALQKDFEAAQVESAQLQAVAQQDVAPKSFRTSVWQLLNVTRNGENPRNRCETEHTLT